MAAADTPRPTCSGSHEIRLPAKNESAATARRFARSCLDASNRDLCDVVVLLVSELVTNAVEHGGPHGASNAVRLHLELLGAQVRVEVTDQSTLLPILGDGAIDSPSGRGLFLVDRLATQWGVVTGARGKTVWLEIEAPDRLLAERHREARRGDVVQPLT